LQVVFLRGGKMEKAQGQRTAAVLDARHQTTAAPEYHVGCPHVSFDYHIRAFSGSGDGGDPGTVLVAQGQVEQQVLHAHNTIIGQFARQFGAYPAQFAHRNIGDALHGVTTGGAARR
jgi:hypothetical protein